MRKPKKTDLCTRSTRPNSFVFSDSSLILLLIVSGFAYTDATANNKTNQPQPGQHHGVGFSFGIGV